jgi:hypothetical protein
MNSRYNKFAVIVGALALPLLFQNCSDVSFSDKASGGDVNANGLCPAGYVYDDIANKCYGLRTENDPRLLSNSTEKIDIMLVIDNSGSMGPDRKKLASKFSNFVNLLENSGYSWQACYITTDVSKNGKGLDWLKPDPDNNIRNSISGSLNEFDEMKPSYVLHKNSAQSLNNPSLSVSDIFYKSIGRFEHESNGSGAEQGIASMSRALDNNSTKDCFRSDASLAMIVISDEDENSCGGRCESSWDIASSVRGLSSYTSQFKGGLIAENMPDALIQKARNKFAALGNENHVFVAHSLVIGHKPSANNLQCYIEQDEESPAFWGKTYESLSTTSNGIVGNICSADYSLELQTMAQRTIDAVSNITLKCAPIGNVTVNLSPLPSGTTWTVSGNKLNFTPKLNFSNGINNYNLRLTYECLDKSNAVDPISQK